MDGPSVDAQARQLTTAGWAKMFRETASGARTDRTRFRRALAKLADGDVLTATRPDRPARSTRDLSNTRAAITDRRAGFRSLTTKAKTIESPRCKIPSWPGLTRPSTQRRKSMYFTRLSKRRRVDGRVIPALDPRTSHDESKIAAINLVRCLGDAFADATTAHGRLILTVLGGLPEFERKLFLARTAEGRARAKANGKSLGRPFKLTEHRRREAVKRRESGEPVRGIGTATISTTERYRGRQNE